MYCHSHAFRYDPSYPEVQRPHPHTHVHEWPDDPIESIHEQHQQSRHRHEVDHSLGCHPRVSSQRHGAKLVDTPPKGLANLLREFGRPGELENPSESNVERPVPLLRLHGRFRDTHVSMKPAIPLLSPPRHKVRGAVRGRQTIAPKFERISLHPRRPCRSPKINCG